MSLSLNLSVALPNTQRRNGFQGIIFSTQEALERLNVDGVIPTFMDECAEMHCRQLCTAPPTTWLRMRESLYG
jgi:hypothetical protein